MRSFDEERAAECQTLIEEIRECGGMDELGEGDSIFVSNLAERLEKHGSRGTFVSDFEYKRIQSLHERVV